MGRGLYHDSWILHHVGRWSRGPDDSLPSALGPSETPDGLEVWVCVHRRAKSLSALLSLFSESGSSLRLEIPTTLPPEGLPQLCGFVL